MAILGLAPHRYGSIHAQGGEDEWLEVRPLLLARAIGHLEGEVVRLGTLGIAPHTAGGRLHVPRAALHAKARRGPARPGGAARHGAEVVEASKDTAHGIIV